MLERNIVELIENALKKENIKYSQLDDHCIGIGYEKKEYKLSIFISINSDSIVSSAFFKPKDNQMDNICKICNDTNRNTISKIYFFSDDKNSFFVSELVYDMSIFSSEYITEWVIKAINLHLQVWDRVLEINLGKS